MATARSKALKKDGGHELRIRNAIGNARYFGIPSAKEKSVRRFLNKPSVQDKPVHEKFK